MEGISDLCDEHCLFEFVIPMYVSLVTYGNSEVTKISVRALSFLGEPGSTNVSGVKKGTILPKIPQIQLGSTKKLVLLLSLSKISDCKKILYVIEGGSSKPLRLKVMATMLIYELHFTVLKSFLGEWKISVMLGWLVRAYRWSEWREQEKLNVWLCQQILLTFLPFSINRNAFNVSVLC